MAGLFALTASVVGTPGHNMSGRLPVPHRLRAGRIPLRRRRRRRPYKSIVGAGGRLPAVASRTRPRKVDRLCTTITAAAIVSLTA